MQTGRIEDAANVPKIFQPTYSRSVNVDSDLVQNVDGIAVSCYENEVPPFVQDEMDRLYGNIYSSLAHLRASGKVSLRDTSTYVVREIEKIKVILLFRHEKGRVRVINEVIAISEPEIRRFVHFMFSTFEVVSVIVFNAIETDIRRVEHPFQRFNYLEDIVVSLPDSTQTYLASLGKGMRRNIKRYTSKLMQDYPTYCHTIQVMQNVNEENIRAIVQLNKARMAGKNKVSLIDDVESLVNQAKVNGLICVITIEGKVCAGAISFQAGQNYFLNILAHDSQYDGYSLGTLCCYLTINECIERGGKEFHFLWGRYPYKYALSGVQRDLDYLAIYRSRFHFFMHFNMALMGEYKSRIRRLMLWLHQAKQRQDFVGRFVNRALGYVRIFYEVKANLFGR